MFKINDVVYVSNPDIEYENTYGRRAHTNFFGKITEITEYENETCVEVDFGDGFIWAYNSQELSLASELENLTLKEFSDRFHLRVNGTFLEYLDFYLPV